MTLAKTFAALLSFTFAASATAAAQTTTAFNTGDRTTGMTKLCYYEALGSEHTQAIESIELCPLSITVRSATTQTPEPQPMLIAAFKIGERTTGMTKLCFYNGLSSEDVKTIKSVGLCPLSIWARPRS